MNETLKNHLESAAITFISFFLLDLGAAVQSLTTHTGEVLQWAFIWSLVVAAARAAVKAVWEKWVNPA